MKAETKMDWELNEAKISLRYSVSLPKMYKWNDMEILTHTQLNTTQIENKHNIKLSSWNTKKRIQA